MNLKDLEDARQCVYRINDSDTAVSHLTSIYRTRECSTSSANPSHSYLVKFVSISGKVTHFVKLGPVDQDINGYLINVPNDLGRNLTPYHVQGEWEKDKGLLLVPMVNIPGLSWGAFRVSHLMVGRQETIRPQTIASPAWYRTYGSIIGAWLFSDHERAPGVKCEYSGTIAGAKHYREKEPCPRCGFTETESLPYISPSDRHMVTEYHALSSLKSIGAIWW